MPPFVLCTVIAVLAAMTTTSSGVLRLLSRPIISSRLSLAQNAFASGVDSPSRRASPH